MKGISGYSGFVVRKQENYQEENYVGRKEHSVEEFKNWHDLNDVFLPLLLLKVIMDRHQ